MSVVGKSVLKDSHIRKIFLLWLAWVLLLFSYQSAIAARYSVIKPDTVLPWTARDTGYDLSDRPYLSEPFLRNHVAWDSEFYLSIATHGYDDPAIRTIPPQPDAAAPFDRALSLNYAFFPAYPFLIRWVAVPLSVVGLNPISTASLAGVLISVLGTLVGMLALDDLARQAQTNSAGVRAAFYLIAFPTGFYLAQVYTEGLFVGLAFGCFALLNRDRWFGAGLLAAIAPLTRAVGVALVIPLALAWVQAVQRQQFHPLSRQGIAKAAIVLAPLVTHLSWKFSFLGGAFNQVEKAYFQCEPFALSRAWLAWRDGLLAVFGGNPQTRVYFAIEFAAVLLGLVTCLVSLRKDPGMAGYGLVVIAISMTCGVAQGMHRYILAIPSVFLVLSRWGSSEIVDRVWTLASILLMGMLTALFTFDLWVG